MDSIDFTELISLSNGVSVEELNMLFFDFMERLEDYLGVPPIERLIKVILEEHTEDYTDIMSHGAQRYYKHNLLIISIDKNSDFLPIIFLRELYYSFVPKRILHRVPIKMVIHELIVLQLSKFKPIIKWNKFIIDTITDLDFYNDDLQQGFKKILSLQIGNLKGEQFFFRYFRLNAPFLETEPDADFFNNIWEDFVLKMTSYLRDDSMVETLRILKIIFFEVKDYRSLLQYKKHFTQFQEKGILSTNQSKKKFEENVKIINNQFSFAPSYQTNWSAINVSLLFTHLQFNPLLTHDQFAKIINNLPFFIYFRLSLSSFGREGFGYFLIPDKYAKDVKSLLTHLEELGYLIDYSIDILTDYSNNLNMNYFRQFHDRTRLINPNHKQYKSQYEFKVPFKYESAPEGIKLTVPKWVILKRSRNWAITGFPFERRALTVTTFVHNLMSIKYSQKNFLDDLEKNFHDLHNLTFQGKPYRLILLKLIESNKKYGFFYIKESLEVLHSNIARIIDILNKNKGIKSINDLSLYIKGHGISNSISDNNMFHASKASETLFRKIVPRFFMNDVKASEMAKMYKYFNDFISGCFTLGIFKLDDVVKILSDKAVKETIIRKKRQAFKSSYRIPGERELNIDYIDETIKDFAKSDPPLLIPMMLTTINTTAFSKYHIIIKIRISAKNYKKAELLIKFFPRCNLYLSDSLIIIEIYMPNIKDNEKGILVSIFCKMFGEDLLYFKRFYYKGIHPAFKLKDYYDYSNSDFFYTQDLFREFSKYVYSLVGRKFRHQKKMILDNVEKFWNLSADSGLDKLVKIIRIRTAKENIDYDIKKLRDILELKNDICSFILDNEKFKTLKNQYFYNNYVHSIKLIPIFPLFGLSQYFLYFKPSVQLTENQIDMKSILNNSFQKIWYPASIGSDQFFLIRYIFPFRSPNKKYIDWLLGSKRAFSEYCFFLIKKIYSLFHFEKNLFPEGWELSYKLYETFLQDLLFDKRYRDSISLPKGFAVGTQRPTDFFGQNTEEFQDLISLYGQMSKDIKNILSSSRVRDKEKISRLIKKGLVIPHIRVKGIGLIDKLYILIPNVKKERMETLIKAFTFFNFGQLYEIEGEFQISGRVVNEEFGLSETAKFEPNNLIKFENGLFIKLYLPNMDISEFNPIFSKLFTYLDIPRFAIFNDMVRGDTFLKHLFDNYDSTRYNPVNNLKWNSTDKIWINHKLLGKDNKHLYPDLYYSHSKTS